MTAPKQAAGGRRQAAEEATAPRSPAPGPLPPAASSEPIAGLDLAAGGATATRGGEDVRRRGWFWHWNSIVTQYAPLIGLKGVGLLNSYTVWTDRREESPHRGYAFPSQQSEADFYGEDRAELITINKILVALDLIEIRKEMVLRTDPQGRRWRVPHNFYRVKDHDDGFSLTGRDVLRVAELADRDAAVYRYVRRVFSPRFAPIDGDNVWHRILPELRQTELWQRLAARAALEEDRASARTRAGHAARRASSSTDVGRGLGMPETGAMATTTDSENDTASGTTPPPSATSVATTNRGSVIGVDRTNDGLTAANPTFVGGTNAGAQTAVGPTNTTYDQSDLTTTTTGDEPRIEPAAAGTRWANDDPGPRPDPATPTGHDDAVKVLAPLTRRPEGDPDGGGIGPRDAPADAPVEATALRAFEEANARAATPAERKLLRGLAERFHPVAVAGSLGDPAIPASGWGWVAAAVYEAVDAGSAFVAPRRLREILARWERDGFPGAVDEGSAAVAAGDGVGTRQAVASRRVGAARLGPTTLRTPGGDGLFDGKSRPETASSPLDVLGAGPDLPLPHGHGSRRTWAFVVGLLAEAIDRATLAELVAGTAIVGYRDGEVTLAVPNSAQAERLSTTHRDLVARKLSEAMRRPIRLAILTVPAGEAGRDEPDDPTPLVASTVAAPNADTGEGLDGELAVPSFLVEECGLPSGQVWAAVLAEVAAGGEVSLANFDAWLRATALVGRAGSGTDGTPLVIGVPHALGRRRIESRFLPALRRAVAAVVGLPLAIEVVVARDWLAAHPGPRNVATAPPSARIAGG